MLYIDTNTFEVVTSDQAKDRRYADTMCRHDWKSYAEACHIATQVTVAMGGELYIGIDNGELIYPRYDIVKAPVIGDEVSYAFNGDYHPDGVIVSVSASLRVVETDSGNRYYRKRLTGKWLLNKTWSLVAGHHNERNPSF